MRRKWEGGKDTLTTRSMRVVQRTSRRSGSLSKLNRDGEIVRPPETRVYPNRLERVRTVSRRGAHMFRFKLDFWNRWPKAAAPEPQYVTARLNSRTQPIDRYDFYEAPLQAMLDAKSIGRVTGGGTQLTDEPAGVAYCDLEIEVSEMSAEALAQIIVRLDRQGAPKGSKLILGASGREIPFGRNEGLGLFINGTDLPDEVYESTDLNDVKAECERLMGEEGSYRGYWHGDRETALYFYGPSFDAMKSALQPALDTIALLERARIEKIA